MRRRHSVVSFRFRSRVQRAEIRMTRFPIVPSSPLSLRPIDETRFLRSPLCRSRLILLGRPKTAPVRNLSPAIYPRFLGDRSIDRYQFRDASLVNGKWNFSFFFFFRDRRTRLETLEFLFGFLILFFSFFFRVWLHRLVNRIA